MDEPAKDPILTLHEQALTLPMEGFQPWALMHLKSLLRFDHALWGMGAGVSGGRAFINSLHLHRLPESMMADYEGLREVDPLAQATTEAVGVVVHLCMEDSAWSAPRFDALRSYARRYGLVNVMCIARWEPVTGTHQFITLTRAQADDRFSADEVRCFGHLAPHAMLGLATARMCLLAKADASAGVLGDASTGQTPGAHWGIGVVDAEGLIHDANPRLLTLFRSEWPQWQGPCLPEAMGAWVASEPRQRALGWTGARLVADVVPVHDCWLIKARPRQSEDSLSERERHVARQFAHGASHKEVAQALGLAPSTVRAHLRSVYSKLGVSRKAQLLALLGAHPG